MGVAFYEKENIMLSNNFNSNNNTTAAETSTNTSCNCNVCNPQPETSTTSTQTSTLNLNLNLKKKSNIFKEIIGNFKEVRIDENNHNLRIVGNNNRIRIAYNVGDLFLIGNNTKLKIETNHGQIKYTGNDGRICLGEDSTAQLVDYSGCNGVLKLKNSKKFKLQKSSQTINKNTDASSNELKSSAMERCAFINKQYMGIQTANSTNCSSSSSNKKPNRKSASYGGSASCSHSSNNNYKCVFNTDNIFERKNSMPNITSTSSSSSTSNKSNLLRPSRIAQHIGNIVITNSANVCITPFTY